MKPPTTTLQEIQRALEAQDRELQAACEALTGSREESVSLPIGALQRLHEVCSVQVQETTTTQRTTGIRC